MSSNFKRVAQRVADNPGTTHIAPDVPASVRAILENEACYGDDASRWRVGKRDQPYQTAAEAEAARRKLVKQLRRFGRAAARAVANRIDTCAPRRRCMNG